jgi:DNA topoisomerase-3
VGVSSPEWLITSARGHLLAEAPPEYYDPALKAWSLDTLPIIPEVTRYIARDKDTGVLLATLVRLLHDERVDVVVNACDAGREGELIFKLITEHAGSTKPIQRAWFSSMTAETLVGALENLLPNEQFAGLEAAARARAEADWLIGINATRAATVYLGGRSLLSLGRVQTPTLALIVGRDQMIADFVPVTYFLVEMTAELERVEPTTLTALHQSVKERSATVGVSEAGVSEAGVSEAGVSEAGVSEAGVSEAGDATGGYVLTRFAAQEEANAVVARVEGRRVVVVSDEVTPEGSRPPHLFDLTTLQKEANTLFGFPASKTLSIAQACYETHKILTYPRTDSSYLTSDMAGAQGALLARIERFGLGDDSVTAGVLASAPDLPERVARTVNDAKVTDHHAIIPTGSAPGALDGDTQRIFTLVLRRYIASLSDAAEYERRVVLLECPESGDIFRAAGRTVLCPGWTSIYPGVSAAVGKKQEEAEVSDESDADTVLPAVAVGEEGVAQDVRALPRTTRPPKAHTDASLLGLMATAGRLLSDEELSAAMKDTGLGTPATRSSIIERLITIGYVERKGRYLRSTIKSRALIGLLGEHILTSPEMTGRWERSLRRLQDADSDKVAEMSAAFSGASRRLATGVVTWLTSLDITGFSLEDVLGPCPVTGCVGEIIVREKSYSCNSWRSVEEPGCGYVLWKKSGDTKLTRAQASAQLVASDGTVPTRAARTVLTTCPTPECTGDILEGAKSFSCSTWKSPKEVGCGYVLWRRRGDGSELDSAGALALIAEGTSDKKEAAEVLAACPRPRCKGGIVEREKSFSCNSWSPKKKGCGTTLWKLSREGEVLVSRENLNEALAALVSSK